MWPLTSRHVLVTWHERQLRCGSDALQAAAPLQMLINDQVIKQGDEAKSFVSGLFGQFGLGGNKATATDASSIAANPLTGTAVTAPTAEAPVRALPLTVHKHGYLPT